MTCDPSALANAARCLQGCIPEGEQVAVLIYLAQQAAGNTQTPAELANSARCIESCIPPGLQLPVLIDLTCSSIDAFSDCTDLSGVQTPAGLVTPQFVGQLYHVTGGGQDYRSTGLTNADWQQINGTGYMIGAGSPFGVVTPVYLGQIYQDSGDSSLWQSTGFTDSDWSQIP